jgi:hypothetical protein
MTLAHRFYPDYDGPIEYRALPFVANSDLKEIVRRHHGKVLLDNIEEIYSFGSLFDAMVLEPHKADLSHEKLERAIAMRDVLFRDKLIRDIFSLPDFRRQHEFYRTNIHGLVGGKCKCDGDSKMMDMVFELKGLTVSSEKQFEEAIDHLDYDQAAAWYIDITNRKHYIIAGSGKKVDKVFKRYVDRNHVIYKRGQQKLLHSTSIWKTYGFV